MSHYLTLSRSQQSQSIIRAPADNRAFNRKALTTADYCDGQAIYDVSVVKTEHYKKIVAKLWPEKAIKLGITKAESINMHSRKKTITDIYMVGGVKITVIKKSHLAKG